MCKLSYSKILNVTAHHSKKAVNMIHFDVLETCKKKFLFWRFPKKWSNKLYHFMSKNMNHFLGL
jgi:hypothetical protein